MDASPAAQKLRIRASVNEWISRNFPPPQRKRLTHAAPEYVAGEKAWAVNLAAKGAGGGTVVLSRLLVGDDGRVVGTQAPERIADRLERLLEAEPQERPDDAAESLIGEGCEFRFGDGVAGAEALPDKSVDLLLTDPPYAISNAYACEQQVPRRLRKNGADFIMPKGNFGDWDNPDEPCAWADRVLPKVRGWAVTFCAQSQIGEYSGMLQAHGFVAVGTLVWHKTNPVPFNHKFKPINAWEALVVGKRPGTPFHGSVVHNVFRCKSPSPQQRIHSTQKPLPLIEEFVRLFSGEGGLVFDPFAGSATTVVAARTLGRNVLAYESNREIYLQARRRVADARGSLM